MEKDVHLDFNVLVAVTEGGKEKKEIATVPSLKA